MLKFEISFQLYLHSNSDLKFKRYTISTEYSNLKITISEISEVQNEIKSFLRKKEGNLKAERQRKSFKFRKSMQSCELCIISKSSLNILFKV